MTDSCRKLVRCNVWLGDLAGEIERESVRLDRTKSWVMRAAWRTARAQIQRLGSVSTQEES